MSERDEFYRRFSQSYDKLHQSERQDDLVERVARGLMPLQGYGPDCPPAVMLPVANALVGMIRAEALEEAAKVADAYDPRCDVCPRGVAAAIRALIPPDR